MKSGINEIIPIYRSKTFWAAIAAFAPRQGVQKSGQSGVPPLVERGDTLK